LKSKPSSPSSKSKSKPHSDSGKGKSKPSSDSGKGKSRPSSDSGKGKSKPSSNSGKGKGKGSNSGKGKGKGSKSGKGKGKGGKGKGGKGGLGNGKGDKGAKRFAYESEKCGEDFNGGCFSDPPVYGNIEFGQTLIGEFGAVLDPESELYERDTDWFLFNVHKPNTCVQATLASIYQGIVVLFEGTTSESQTCTDNLIDVASGDSFGAPAVYCFPEAGQYGVFVSPEFMDDTPCKEQPFNYYLVLEHVECGTCLMESENPGCSDEKCKRKVCKQDKSCCDDSWSAACVTKARQVCDCTDGDNIVDEDEPCGEDVNGGCNSDPPIFGSIEFGQTIIGKYGAVWDPSDEIFEQDKDWFLFDIKEPQTCVRATLDSVDDGIVVLFESSTVGVDSCEDIVDVASGDNDGNPAVYCFSKAGKYGVFVAPEFQDESPCEGEPHTYILALEHLDKCGTCLQESESPGCAKKKCESTVCELDGSCCDDAWDATCVEKAKLWCECAGGEVPDIINEDEPCGEDINGGCYNDPPAYGYMELGQTLIGEYGAVWVPSLEIYQIDTDWFLFQTDKPGTCVQAILTSRGSGDVVLFEGSTFDYLTCEENLVNVASGESNKDPAVYCFAEAGEYGVFVAPTSEQETPCEGDPSTYVLTLNGLDCGTCFIEHDAPGCSDMTCKHKVCDYDKSCCNDAWDVTCVEKAKLWCNGCKEEDKPGSKVSSSSDRGKGKGSQSRSTDSDSGKGSRSQSGTHRSDSGKGGSQSSSERGKGKGSRSRSTDSDSGKGGSQSSGESGKVKGSRSRNTDSDSGKGSQSQSGTRSSDSGEGGSQSMASKSRGEGKDESSKMKGKVSKSKGSKGSKRSKFSKSH
jgi:hypothetical protein